MRIVIDTNVVVSWYFSTKGAPSDILRLWKEGKIEIITSPTILDEYARVLNEAKIRAIHRMTDDELKEAVSELAQQTVLVHPTRSLMIVPHDPDDNKFVECAVAGHADFIISGDKHFVSLGAFEEIQILQPSLFMIVFEGGAPD